MNKRSFQFHFAFFFFLAIVFLSSLPACARAKEKEARLSENVLAVVNQENIYKDDFEYELDRFLTMYNFSRDNTVLGNRSPHDTVLDQLIKNKLFDQEIRRLSITVSVKELDDELRHVSGDYTPDEFSRRLNDKKISYKKWMEGVRRNLLIQKLLQREILQEITFTEKEMRDYYDANQADFSLSDRVEVNHIIVSDESEAHRIYEDLLAGADFNKKSKKHSLGITSQAGGQMGIFSPGQLPEAFDKVIFKLKPGQFSDVIKTPYGYHLFKVIRSFEAKTMDFEEAKDSIKKNLLKKRESEAFTNWLHNLKNKSAITINQEYFKKTAPVKLSAK